MLTPCQSHHLHIFSHSAENGYLFTLSTASFAMQKLLSVSMSHVFTFAFIAFGLGDRSKKKKNSDTIYVKEVSAHVFF